MALVTRSLKASNASVCSSMGVCICRDLECSILVNCGDLSMKKERFALTVIPA